MIINPCVKKDREKTRTTFATMEERRSKKLDATGYRRGVETVGKPTTNIVLVKFLGMEGMAMTTMRPPALVSNFVVRGSREASAHALWTECTEHHT